MEESWKQKMELIKKCRDCGYCKKRCPYELDIPVLLKKSLEYYNEFYEKYRNQS
jgi:predicted aldo/keto reductase-like oxidoreductase